MPIRRDGKLVAEISLENSLFDQNGFLRGLAFVVDVERSAAPGHGAVVDDRASFAGDALADQAGEGGSFLAIEVGFESVADGFVQQDAGPSGAEDDFHFSGRSFAGVELQNRLARGFLGEEFGILVAEEEVEGDTASAAGSAAGGVAFGLGDAGDVHARQRLRVFGERSVGSDDENVAEFVGVAGADFLNAGIVGAGGFVGAHDEFDLGADFGVDATAALRDRGCERRSSEIRRPWFLRERWRSTRRCARRAGCGRKKDRRCRRIRCARRRRRGLRIRRRFPGSADLTMDSSTISEVEERYSK